MAIAFENPTTTLTGLLPVIRITVWLLNRMNLFCGFPSLWVLSPVRAQPQVSFALYCSHVTTAMNALAEQIAVLCLRSSPIDPWIWIVSEICKPQIKHLAKSSGEQHRKHIANNHSWSMVLFFAPAAILNATTSAAMLLYERNFDHPWPPGQTPLMQILLGCFTLMIFIFSRYADYMILRSSYPPYAHDILIGSIGILSLFLYKMVMEHVHDGASRIAVLCPLLALSAISSRCFLLVTHRSMRTVNLLAATATIISFTSASAQVIGHLGNACTGEELSSETLSPKMCVSVADIESSSSMTISGLARGRVNFYYNDHCTDEVDHTTFNECYLGGSQVNSFIYKE